MKYARFVFRAESFIVKRLIRIPFIGIYTWQKYRRTLKKNKPAHLSLCLTTLLAAQPNNRGSFPGSAKYFSLKRPKLRWGPRRILCNESRVIFSGVKAASDCQADHSPLSSAEFTDGAVLTLPNSPAWRTREQLQVYLVITDKKSAENSPMSSWCCLSLVRAF
jgi:hypothetical protein